MCCGLSKAKPRANFVLSKKNVGGRSSTHERTIATLRLNVAPGLYPSRTTLTLEPIIWISVMPKSLSFEYAFAAMIASGDTHFLHYFVHKANVSHADTLLCRRRCFGATVDYITCIQKSTTSHQRQAFNRFAAPSRRHISSVHHGCARFRKQFPD